MILHLFSHPFIFLFPFIGPFRRGVLLHVHMSKHAQKRLEVGQTACANKTLDYMFLQLNCLCLSKSKICACYYYTDNSHLLLN